MDVIVAQGTEAGGHTGHRAMLPLLQEALELTDRPVVAAGGIAGRGMAPPWWRAPPRSGSGRRCSAARRPELSRGPRPGPRRRRRRHRADPRLRRRAAPGLAERWPGRALVNEFSRAWHGREAELLQDDVASQRVVDAEEPTTWSRRRSTPAESVGLVTAERSASDVVRRLTADAREGPEGAAKLLGQTEQVSSTHPSAGGTVTSGWLSAQARSRICSSRSAGWAPAAPYFRSTTKKGTPVAPSACAVATSCRTAVR